MKTSTIKTIKAHAESEYPKESCGLIVSVEAKEKYIPCRNDAPNPTQDFSINPEDYASAEDQGEVIGIVHSHPDASNRASPKDLAVMNSLYSLQLSMDSDSKPIPWHIISWPEGEINTVLPDKQVPLLGRDFVHNYWDCWQVCADYYKREYNLDFPRWQREDGWWEVKDGPSHYEDFYEGAGFIQVQEPEVGDIIVMQIGRTYHPNHASVYLGTEPKLPQEDLSVAGQGPFILHHLYGKKSEVVVYGGQWEQRTRMILRHKSSFKRRAK